MSELYLFLAPQDVAPRTISVDICILGGTSAGVVAALQASREGKTSAILECTNHLGGLTAGGLSETDYGKKPAIGGQSLEFYRAAGREYGIEEEWKFEPKVAEKIFEEWALTSGALVFKREYIESVRVEGRKIISVSTRSGLTVEAKAFLDCSYEGDLYGLAGCSFHVGRESNEVYGETVNGAQVRQTHQFYLNVSPYKTEFHPESGLLPGIEAEQPKQGEGDGRLQAYNFRLCLTQKPENRRPWPKPEGYDRKDWVLLERLVRAGYDFEQIDRKYDRIRGEKCDKNNHGAISTDFIGGNWDYPLASWERREEIFQAHVRWQQGFFYFMGNDDSVPQEIRDFINSWGLTKDEFPDCDGWSHALYVREGRRLVSDYVINQNDCNGTRVCNDSVGLGSYTMDSHNCTRFVDENGFVRNEGDVQDPTPPYPISYRAIVPKRGEVENLWVPVACSTSHIAYGSLRMEPVFMILGQSAAIAACLALDEKIAAQDLDYARLRPKLEAVGQVLEWKK